MHFSPRKAKKDQNSERSYMYGHLKKICGFLFCLGLITFPLCPTCFAYVDEEMLILQMYYADNDLVISPTRHPKLVSQVAENITVVTAKEIEEMNAHTVADVLNRIPGVFLNSNHGFGASSLINIQGSDHRDVLVLVDGITWNFLASGAAETNSIPVAIIERIEVIKGPASSAWGSSLGGVINIITKPTGHTKRPQCAISASNGEKNTNDYRAEVSGRFGPVGYYLFGGHQESDGLPPSPRCFDNDSFYSKFGISVSKDVNIGLSAGYSEPHAGFGDVPVADITSKEDSRTFFTTAFVDARFNKKLSARVSLYTFKQRVVKTSETLGLGIWGSSKEFFEKDVYDEDTIGGNAKLVWEDQTHTVVFGADFEHGKLDQTINTGQHLQSPPHNAPPTTKTNPDIAKWAIYANDTIVIDRLSITPGIRYDHNDITGSFTSPSLGITYELAANTILRASVARGFTIPPLSWTSGGALFIDPNPSLEPEEVWSYQAGAESSVAKYLWLKATLFRHVLKNALTDEASTGGLRYVNGGKIRRQGVEIEAETLPVYDVSLFAGVGYVHIKPSGEPQSAKKHDRRNYKIGVRYDDTESFKAELFGQNVWWDLGPDSKVADNNFIWDLNLTKKICSTEKSDTAIFLAVHNIFNGSQYDFADIRSPERWVEAGIRVRF
ncbi:MAG: TonB-dependent receptor [Deltaproteobacteria bacterium]|nr:TonB-dependent receptor [Deltaproteobacteria bacterium]